MRHKEKYFVVIVFLIFVISSAFIFYSCTENKDKDIVPVNNVNTNTIDEDLALKGRFVFTKKCMECHALDVNLKGPALKDVTKQRKSEWIMNMILNTEDMLQKDSIAKKLLSEHVIKMTVTNVNPDDAKAVLEYLRSVKTPDSIIAKNSK